MKRRGLVLYTQTIVNDLLKHINNKRNYFTRFTEVFSKTESIACVSKCIGYCTKRLRVNSNKESVEDKWKILKGNIKRKFRRNDTISDKIKYYTNYIMKGVTS